MNPWLLVVALGLAIACGFGGMKVGAKLERQEWQEREITKKDRIIVQIQKEVEVREKVVTKYADRVQTITVKETEVRNEIPTVVHADCIVPPDLLLLLHAASRNTTVSATGATEKEAAGADCRSVAKAISDSYANHYKAVEQLNAILDLEEK